MLDLSNDKDEVYSHAFPVSNAGVASDLSAILEYQSIHIRAELIMPLLEMDDRIRLYRRPVSWLSDQSLNRGVFHLTKQHIYFPSCAPPTIIHEIAHAVEMKDPKRWCLPDWGMPKMPVVYRKSWEARGGKPDSSFVLSAAAREIRVRAIQKHLTNNTSEITSYAQVDNASGGFKGMAESVIPYGRFQSEQQLEDWAITLGRTTYQQWNYDRIREEWKLRIKSWQQHMETMS